MRMALFFSAVICTEEIATVYTGYPLIKISNAEQAEAPLQPSRQHRNRYVRCIPVGRKEQK